MRITENFNGNWLFRHGFDAAHAGVLQEGETVRLPHSAVELPYNYFDETDYQKPFTYQNVLDWRADFEGREVSLVFDAAMADSVVYLNGKEIIAHKDGYTPFEARLTPHLKQGENIITVKIDGSENPEIPPFGGQIDYLCYAGIYRDVWLKVTSPVSIANVKIETPDALAQEKTVTARVFLANPQGLAASGTLEAKIRRESGGGDVGVHVSASGRDIADHGGEGRYGCGLGDEPGDARSKRALEYAGPRVAGNQDGFDPRVGSEDAFGGVDAVRGWHLQVQEHDVGIVRRSEGDHVIAIVGLGDHGEVIFEVEQGDDRGTDQFFVVGDEHPDHVAPTVLGMTPRRMNQPSSMTVVRMPPAA